MHILPLLYNKIEYNWFVNEAETSKRKEGVSKLIHSLFLHKAPTFSSRGFAIF